MFTVLGFTRRLVKLHPVIGVYNLSTTIVGAMTLAVDDNTQRTEREEIDLQMMRRCLELSKIAARQGELPFASLIARNGKIVAEATNRVTRDCDVTRHAELLALSDAQRATGKKRLPDYTIYSNIEPCAMCSFPIREARISRVVFSIKSPLMGGYSRWNVLCDDGISNAMPEAFGDAPEILSGVLAREAEKVWRDWNPLVWTIIKKRGCFTAAEECCDKWHKAPGQQSLLRRFLTSLDW
jgi:tRNA(adenine34) deaminase